MTTFNLGLEELEQSLSVLSPGFLALPPTEGLSPPEKF